MSREESTNSGKITSVTTCGGTIEVNGKESNFYSGAITGVKEGQTYEYTTVKQQTKGGEEQSKIITKKVPN